MARFLLHFFPLFTFGLFFAALTVLVRYMGSVRDMEKHMEANRSEEWDEMGKPSIFARKNRDEKREQFRAFVDEEAAGDTPDWQLLELWEKSRRLRRWLSVVTWSTFGMYVFTIVAVKYLLSHLQGG